jgi:hypothetical protein
MKTLTYNEMLLKLEERFPKLEVLDNNEFSRDAKLNSAFWLRNADSINYTNKDKNTLYQSMSYDFKNYDFEVYKKFNNFCNRFGWYATSESYTLQVFSL